MRLHRASRAFGGAREARWTCIAALLAAACTAAGCDVNAALQRVSQASHLSADLLVQFAKATDAAKRRSAYSASQERNFQVESPLWLSLAGAMGLCTKEMR